MKKMLISTLGLGLVIGAMGITSFANDNGENISDVDLSNVVQSEATFKVLNQETTQYQQLDVNNNLDNNNANTPRNGQYMMNQGSCCDYSDNNYNQN